MNLRERDLRLAMTKELSLPINKISGYWMTFIRTYLGKSKTRIKKLLMNLVILAF